MGKPMRRLRALLPRQARGRRHRRNPFHRYRLQALDGKTCKCIDYPRRHKRVPDCVRLTADVVRQLSWLPVTCAYRLVAKGEDLPDWHPLVSGSPDSVHEAGVSVRGRVWANESDIP